MSRARKAAAIVLLAGLAAAAFWALTAPAPLDATALPRHVADRANGGVLFHAGSCLWCHKPGPGTPHADVRLPSGGAPFKTPVGTFYPQNLTPDVETGIGGWTDLDFVNAMVRGISPSGQHYFPAFPYPSFRSMRLEDVLDLRAYLMSLPPLRSPGRAPGIPLAWLARRGVGLWKRLALRTPPFRPHPGHSASWNRGSYLVHAPGHCGECHTPRNLLMIPDESRYLAGGPHPAGEGNVPSLRGLLARHRYRNADDLSQALRYGETLGYDKLSSGGMGAIQSNLALLPEGDLRAISEYLLTLE
jgi:mono/diheme cytochrome c family protein